MQLIGTRGQTVQTPVLDFSGTITSGGTAQLLLPNHKQRSYLLVQNISVGNLVLQLGMPQVTCTISNGVVQTPTVVNAGFGFSYAPSVTFMGGGPVGSDGLTDNGPHGYSAANTTYTTTPLVNRTAVGHCVMAGNAPSQTISSITLDDAGYGYTVAPYVLLTPDPRDPNGCAVPSATSGIIIGPNGSFVMEHSACTTSAVAIWGATTGQAFTCKVVV